MGPLSMNELSGERFLRLEQAQIFRFYLFLHELGHMLLHRNDLWSRKIDTDPTWFRGGQATVNMELEADVAAKIFARRFDFTIPADYFFKEGVGY